jgi:hypothetical protein
VNSLGLELFHRLCAVGDALQALRDLYAPSADEWLWHTELLGQLDAAIDMLVYSGGLETDHEGT